ncbi:MAG: TolC family protein [Mucilaginibacter polytrichastri]|nr:TolC family protein [Mucilaginibacter polytrichastri]
MTPPNNPTAPHCRRRTGKRGILFGAFFTLLFQGAVFGQQKQLTMDEAIKLGLENSKTLKLSQARVEEAVSRYKQAADGALPTASASYLFSRAFFLNDGFKLPGTPDSSAFALPKHADAQVGTASIQELIYGGGRLRYAKQSTDLLAKAARLDVDRDREGVVYTIVSQYYTLFKIGQSQKVLAENIKAIDKQLRQSKRFFEQGLVTKNDVLRLELERANASIDSTELQANLSIANFNFDVLLGLPESTELAVAPGDPMKNDLSPLASYLDSALSNRAELRSSELQTRAAESNIHSLKAEKLPTLGAAGSLYYINPSTRIIPAAGNEFLGPYTLGLSLSWNISNLWTSKNKISEARIKKDESVINRSILADNIKNEVNQSYQRYVQALEKVRLLQASVGQASENNKILESKYQNNVASITDRIDANTQLFRTEINLEVARADAGLAYYTLLKSTGKLHQL